MIIKRFVESLEDLDSVLQVLAFENVLYTQGATWKKKQKNRNGDFSLLTYITERGRFNSEHFRWSMASKRVYWTKSTRPTLNVEPKGGLKMCFWTFTVESDLNRPTSFKRAFVRNDVMVKVIPSNLTHTAKWYGSLRLFQMFGRILQARRRWKQTVCNVALRPIEITAHRWNWTGGGAERHVGLPRRVKLDWRVAYSCN